MWNLLLLAAVVFAGYAVYKYYVRKPDEALSPEAKVGAAIVGALGSGGAWAYLWLAGLL